MLSVFRGNVKKSLAGLSVGLYGVNYGVNAYEKRQYLRDCCLEALKYGDATSDAKNVPYRVTVILNPAANHGKGKKNYENYGAPILHCAGIKVSVIRTEGTGQAKEIMEIIKDADAVLVAGGDGTLMETLTGLLRRNDELHRCLPLGVIPVGKENVTAKSLFPGNNGNDVKLTADAAMSVVRGLYRPMDVLQIRDATRATHNMDNHQTKKSIYALNKVEIGAFRDAHQRRDKYWFTGSAQKFLTYLFSFTTSSKHILWNVTGRIKYALENPEKASPLPVPTQNGGGWFSWGSAAKMEETAGESPTIDRWISLPNLNTMELILGTSPLNNRESDHKLNFYRGAISMNLSEFVKEGFRRETEIESKYPDEGDVVKASSLQFFPPGDLKEGTFFSVDNENVELEGPLEVNLLPDKIFMFCNSDMHYQFRVEEKKPQMGGNTRWWRNSNKITI